MAAKFTAITASEMAGLLEPWGFRLMSIEGTRELVWQKTRPELEIQIRVYSGIEPTGVSRGVGEDAIRVEVYWIRSPEKVYRIGGSKRVNRTQNWRKSLEQRIRDWKEMLGIAGKVVHCPNCGFPMAVRTIRHGEKMSSELLC